MVTSMKKRIKKITLFFSKTIWEIELESRKGLKQKFLQFLRILILSVNEFNRDKCVLWSSALTYITTLSIVPFLAVAFAVTKAFKLYNKLHDSIIEQVTLTMPDFVPLVEQILSFTENVNVNTLGVMGIIFIFVFTISLLSSVEKAFNQIWLIKKQRNLYRKITDYITLTIVLPILLIVGFTLSGLPKLKVFIKFINSLNPPVNNLIHIFLPVIELILPFLFIWAAIAALYSFMPNAKIKTKSVLLGSLIIAVIWLFTFNMYIKLQIGVERNESIYGQKEKKSIYTILELNNSHHDPKEQYIILRKKYKEKEMIHTLPFKGQYRQVTKYSNIAFTDLPEAIHLKINKEHLKKRDLVYVNIENNTLKSIKKAEYSIGRAFSQLPVLLLLMYISWALLFFGAEIAYAHQHTYKYQKEKKDLLCSIFEKKAVLLYILYLIGNQFEEKSSSKFYSVLSLSEKVNFPLHKTQELLDILELKGYLISRSDDSDQEYFLAQPSEQINLSQLVFDFEHLNEGSISLNKTNALKKIFELIKSSSNKNNDNITLKKLMDQLNAI
jgi:YihY family inner membrane protein